jgi:tetratricopeptide (TPR) repeat protein
MYTWQGLPERSLVYYKKSVDLKPADANTREKLIESYSMVYYLKDALDQLDSLHQRKEINFPMQLLMAKYCIHSGRFTDAGNLLKEAKQIHPFNVTEITDLNGRLQLLSNHPKEALKYYMEYLSANPGDSLTMYTIARLYAKMNIKKEAWKWLKMSIDKGFYFYWALKMDESWNDYRKLPQWNAVTKKVTQDESYLHESKD